MPRFGPGIGKQHPDFLKGDSGLKRKEKFTGFSTDKVAVGKLSPVTLATAAFQAIKNQVHPNTKFLRKKFRVSNEEVAMSAAYFPDDGARNRQKRRQIRPQRGAALCDDFEKFRFVAHDAFWDGRRGPCKPEAAVAGKSGGNGGFSRDVARQSHENRSAPPHFAFRPYPTAMELDNMFHDTEAETGPAGFP